MAIPTPTLAASTGLGPGSGWGPGLQGPGPGTAAVAADSWIDAPDVSHLVTEDDTPVDNMRSEKQQRLLTEPLYSSWKPAAPDGGTRRFLATANVGLYVALDGAPLVPDVMLGMDVASAANLDDKPNRAWLSWVVGKPPDLVIEIVSNREGDELSRKRRRYAEMRVPWYVVWDPAMRLRGARLNTFEIAGDLFVPRSVADFPTIGLRLVEWDGEFEGAAGPWLRWALPDGTLLPTGAERAKQEAERAEQEARRAEQEARRADQEARRAEQEAQRAEHEAERAEHEAKRADEADARVRALEEKLRGLGITVD